MIKTIKRFQALIPAIVFLGLWELYSGLNPKREFIFSSPSKIILSFVSQIPKQTYWFDVIYTTSSALIGLILGTAIGTIFGVLFFVRPKLASIFNPYLASLGAVPIFAIAPMLIIWFGIGFYSKIMMSTLSVVLVSFFQAFEGANQVSSQHLIFGKSLGADTFRLIRFIIFPGALNSVIFGIKVNISFALTGSFVAEFISSEYGVGHYILRSGGIYDTANVFVGIITLILISGLIRLIVSVLFEKNRTYASNSNYNYSV